MGKLKSIYIDAMGYVGNIVALVGRPDNEKAAEVLADYLMGFHGTSTDVVDLEQAAREWLDQAYWAVPSHREQLVLQEVVACFEDYIANNKI